MNLVLNTQVGTTLHSDIRDNFNHALELFVTQLSGSKDPCSNPLWCRHISVDSPEPPSSVTRWLFYYSIFGHFSKSGNTAFILPPQVQVPNRPTLFLHFQSNLYYLCHVKRTKFNKKRPGLAHEKHWGCSRFKDLRQCQLVVVLKVDVSVKAFEDITRLTKDRHVDGVTAQQRTGKQRHTCYHRLKA